MSNAVKSLSAPLAQCVKHRSSNQTLTGSNLAANPLFIFFYFIFCYHNKFLFFLHFVFILPFGIRTQLLPLNGRTRHGYTYTQNSSPIYWGVNLTNHVELLLLMSVWLDCCLSFQEMLNWWRYLVISGI